MGVQLKKVRPGLHIYALRAYIHAYKIYTHISIIANIRSVPEEEITPAAWDVITS